MKNFKLKRLKSLIDINICADSIKRLIWFQVRDSINDSVMELAWNPLPIDNILLRDDLENKFKNKK